MQDLKFETSTFQQQVKDEGLRTGVLMDGYDILKGVSVGGRDVAIVGPAGQGSYSRVPSEYRNIQPQSANGTFGQTSTFILTDNEYAVTDAILQIDLSALTSTQATVAQVYTIGFLQGVASSPVYTWSSGSIIVGFAGNDMGGKVFWTSPIPYNASAILLQVAIQNAINALPSMQNISGLIGYNASCTVALAGAYTGLTITLGGALGLEFVPELFSVKFIGTNSQATQNPLSICNITTAGVDLASSPEYLPNELRWADGEELIEQVVWYAQGGTTPIYQITNGAGSQMARLADFTVEEHVQRGFDTARIPTTGHQPSSVFIQLPGPFNLPDSSMPLYALDSDIQLKVLFRTMQQCIKTNYRSGQSLLAGSIVNMTLWLKYEMPMVRERNRIMSIERPILWSFPCIIRTDLTPITQQSVSGMALNRIQGNFIGLCFYSLPAVQTYANDFINFSPLANFQLKSGSGNSISGYSTMPMTFLQRELMLNEWVGTDSVQPKASSRVVVPADKLPKFVYVYSFSDDLKKDLQHGTSHGHRYFDGTEKIDFSYPTAANSPGYVQSATPPGTPSNPQNLVVLAFNAQWYKLFGGRGLKKKIISLQ